jgi:hypothetical protein
MAKTCHWWNGFCGKLTADNYAEILGDGVKRDWVNALFWKKPGINKSPAGSKQDTTKLLGSTGRSPCPQEGNAIHHGVPPISFSSSSA